MNNLKDNLTLIIASVTILGFLANGYNSTKDLIDKVNGISDQLEEQSSWVISHTLSFAGALDNYKTDTDQTIQVLLEAIDRQDQEIQDLKDFKTSVCEVNTLKNKIGNACDED